jgi:hypothetical protein
LFLRTENSLYTTNELIATRKGKYSNMIYRLTKSILPSLLENMVEMSMIENEGM